MGFFVFFLLLLLFFGRKGAFFFVQDHLCRCCGSVKRVKEGDKATAGYRLSNSHQSPGRHLQSQTIFTPDYRVSNAAIARGTSHFLRPSQANGQLSRSLSSQPNPANNLTMQTRHLPGSVGSRQTTQSDFLFIYLFFFRGARDAFVAERLRSEICTRRARELVRASVHLLAAARLPRSDAAQWAARVKIYKEQLPQPKLTLGGVRCMINHGGQGAADSSGRRRTPRAELRRQSEVLVFSK